MVSLANLTSETFSLAEAQSLTIPLVIFILGVVLYAFFIFKFYRFLAKRDIFSLDLQKYSSSFLGIIGKVLRSIFYVIEYVLVFPIFTFFWFLILAVILSILSRTHEAANILLISMALVASVRVTAYYSEELSRDLAKMLPFALLGIFLVDVSYFSFEGSLTTLKTFPALWKQMVYYLGFTILLEFVLRMGHGILSPFLKKEEKS